MPWGSLLGAVAGPVIGGLLGSGGSSDASGAMAQSAQQANALNAGLFNAGQATTAPYRLAGQNALVLQQRMLGLRPARTAYDNAIPHLGSDGTLTFVDPHTGQNITGLGGTGSSTSGGQSGGQSGSSYTDANGFTAGGQYVEPFHAHSPNYDEARLGPNYESTLRQQQGLYNPDAGSGQSNPGQPYTPDAHPEDDQPYNFQTTDPSYAFNRDQGLLALDRRAAAGGHLLGGGALKDALTYASGLASNEFSNQFARLGSISGLGANSTARNNQTSLGAGGLLNDSLGAQGSANAAGDVGQSRAWGNVFNTPSVGSAIQKGIGTIFGNGSGGGMFNNWGNMGNNGVNVVSAD